MSVLSYFILISPTRAAKSSLVTVSLKILGVSDFCADLQARVASLICPFCISIWTSVAFLTVLGITFAPASGRLQSQLGCLVVSSLSGASQASTPEEAVLWNGGKSLLTGRIVEQRQAGMGGLSCCWWVKEQEQARQYRTICTRVQEKHIN